MNARSWRDRGLVFLWVVAAFAAGSLLSMLPANGADAVQARTAQQAPK